MANGADCNSPEENDDTSTNSTLDFFAVATKIEPQITESTVATKIDIENVFDIIGIGDDVAQSSVETVCKEYQLPVIMTEKKTQGKSFSDFLQESEVALMVRCNFPYEPGMPRKELGYSADRLRDYGVNHMDIQFVDKDGGLPARRHVAAMIRAGAPVIEADAGAVLVHCKGGFGRSVVLACCLMIHTYDVSGRALLGWMRIARPGAITTPQQEEFLMSLKGQADVDRFAGIYQEANDEDAARTACRVGCTVQ
jgi:hypothetical protein